MVSPLDPSSRRIAGEPTHAGQFGVGRDDKDNRLLSLGMGLYSLGLAPPAGTGRRAGKMVPQAVKVKTGREKKAFRPASAGMAAADNSGCVGRLYCS
jgi:hypothetical protein